MLRAEQGFTLIEVLAAVALISIGVASTLRIFGAAGRTTLRAQRTDVAVQQAQAELDRMRTLHYGELALTAQPGASNDVTDPGSRVQGTSLRIRQNLVEPLVFTSGPGATASVDPGPKDFAVGVGDATITGHIYRYVTWRDESCPYSLCDGTQNTKRLLVAVTLDSDPVSEHRFPLWLSTVISDPDAAPPGAEAPPGGGPGSGDPVTAQSFFLYDTPCGQSSRVDPTETHPTRDTASAGASAADASTCEQADPARQPDLMGNTPPAGDRNTPLFGYSADVANAHDGGLTLLHRGVSCTATYPAADAQSAQAVSKWAVHDWSTAAMSQSFALSGLVTVSLFTTTIDAVVAPARLCATLVDRETTDGVPSDRVLGTGVYDLSTWPTTIRRLTFSFRLAQEEIVPPGHRLVLALQLRGESGADIAVLYDHPLYPSTLEVATSTPL
jgi:prepilin-type N-terminal cleavage/methylation domain-containing protein